MDVGECPKGDWASFLAFSPGSREVCRWPLLNDKWNDCHSGQEVGCILETFNRHSQGRVGHPFWLQERATRRALSEKVRKLTIAGTKMSGLQCACP